MFFTLFTGIVLLSIFNTSAGQGDEERTVEISIIVIAALIIFFLLIAWCGFLFGLYRNRKFAKEMKMVEQNHQLRQQKWKQRQQQRKQQLLEQQQQLQQQQQQQQRQQQQQIIRPMLHPPPSQCSHSRQSSYNSGMSTPSAPPLPLAVPPRDYPDYSPSLNASVSSRIGYQSRGAFDHLQGYSSPEHSFINPGYKSAASPQDHSPFHSGYSPVPPRSTSTPATKKPCKTSKPSNPAYNMEMHQYSQLQNWPQNY